MLMLDRDGTLLAPERNTSLADRIAHVVVWLGGWGTLPDPSSPPMGKVAQLGTPDSSGTGSSSHHHILRSTSE